MPNLADVYASIPNDKLLVTLLFGIGWGLGGVFWGKAIAAVGMALGVTLLMGFVNVFGSIAPLAIFQNDKIATAGGLTLMLSVAVMLVGVAFIARAGKAKEEELEAGKTTGDKSQPSTRFSLGLFFCVISGALSALVNFSFISGADIATAAERSGASLWAKGLAIWAIVFTGNYLVNFLYAAWLMFKNNTFQQIGKGDLRHWGWVFFMGLSWPGGIIIYGIAANKLGSFGAYVGFPMMLICSILFGNLAGALTGEWKGTTQRSRLPMIVGVVILGVALCVMGLSNNLLAR